MHEYSRRARRENGGFTLTGVSLLQLMRFGAFLLSASVLQYLGATNGVKILDEIRGLEVVCSVFASSNLRCK